MKKLYSLIALFVILLFGAHKMTLKIVFNSNILNNKGIQISFSVQILSIFTFPSKNPASFHIIPLF